MHVPGFKMAHSHTAIVRAAKRRNRAAQGLFGSIHIAFAYGEVGSKEREKEFDELAVLGKIRCGSVAPLQLADELFVRQKMERTLARVQNPELRRAMRSDEQMNWKRQRPAAKLPGQLEADEPAHADAEERYWNVVIPAQRLREVVNEGAKL